MVASRRRLVVAADEERSRLADDLRAGVELDVAELRAGIAVISAAGDADVVDHLRAADEHLAATASDVRQIAAGLHPRDLDRGLADAVARLCERSPVPATLTTGGLDDVEAVAFAAYCVCSEGLANVAKHSNASRVDVDLSTARHRACT